MKNVKTLFFVLVVISLVLVIVQNTEPVTGRFLWFTAEIPVILLLALTSAGGFIVGLLVPLFIRRRESSFRITKNQ